MSKTDLLFGLTREQKSAVTHTSGPILVVAGAGTGKTTVITRRIAWLVSMGHAKPEEILALTFTEKAATEMTERVDELSDFIYSGIQISTFHSFGSDLISEFAFELGLPADFRVLTDVEQILFVKDHIFDFKLKHYQNLSDPTSLTSEMVKVFSRAKDECISPAEYLASVKKALEGTKDPAEREELEKQLEIGEAYAVYQKLLCENGYIDYGDQINLVLTLLAKPSIKKKLRQRFKYALVDEFQDTNYAQSCLVKEIFGTSGNVMIVGDDDQSIYRFRGASTANILNFRDEYQKVKTIILSQNFRSTQKILDAAYRLIQNNNPQRLEAKYKFDKKLTSTLGEGKEPRLLLFESESTEAEAVADKIAEGIKTGRKYEEFAVLVRANTQAEEFGRTFAARGIPFVFSGAAGLYQKLEVKMLIALIKILNQPDDDLALYHLAMSDVYNMNADELARLSHWSARHNRSLAEVFAGAGELDKATNISAATSALSEKIITDLSNLREESKNSSAGEVINLFLRESGYYGKLTRQAKEGSIEAHNKISNVAAFFDKIIHFQRNYKDHSLKKFAEYLNLILEAGDDPKSFEPTEGLEAVNILTVHKAKGLEFETVFMVSLSDSHFPGRGRSEKLPIPELLRHQGLEDDQEDLREERRLFYVAATRAKKELYLTSSLDYGTKRTHKISRFVIEMLGDDVVEKRFLKTESVQSIKHFEKVSSLAGIALEPVPESERIILSRAAIDDWLTCPFKYQLIHVTPIRIMADSNIAYGNAVHNTIGEYYKRRMSGKKVAKSEMKKFFDLFWDETGFLTRTHEQKRYEKGIRAIEEFYLRAEKEQLPLSIEREFKFRVGNNIIRGRYDAVFGHGKETEITDYKTSNVTKKDEADKRTKESTQLATYALSWRELNGYIPAAVHLYFVENGLVGTYIPSEKDIARTKTEITSAAEGIRKRNFKATPQLFTCKYCPFKLYCPEAILEKVAS